MSNDMLPTHTNQLTSPFSKSHLVENIEEHSLGHFIKHLVSVKESSNVEFY